MTGQAVPAGLHVRMNLETGEREAKLMDGEDEFKYWRDGDRQGTYINYLKQYSNILGVDNIGECNVLFGFCHYK